LTDAPLLAETLANSLGLTHAMTIEAAALAR
jgi:hypothetical protein